MDKSITYYYYLNEIEVPSDCGGQITTHKIYLIRFIDNGFEPDSYRFVIGRYNNCNEYIDTITCLTTGCAIGILSRNKVIKVKKEIEYEKDT